jgi:hypothetical protein
MSLHRPVLRALAASAFLIVMPFSMAHAADPDDVAKRLKALFAEQGVDLQWSGVSGSSSSMVLSGVTAGAAGKQQRVPIGDVTLSDVTEADGAYVVGEAALPNYSVTQAGSTFNMQGVTISGLRLPPEGAEKSDDPLGGLMIYKKAEIKNVSVQKDGKDVFSLADFHVDLTLPEGNDPLKFAGAAESFSVDLSGVEDAQSKQAIQSLGYEKLDGHFETAGSWAPKDGTLALDKYDISVKNAGTLGISLTMSGYTPAFIKSLREMQQRMAANPDKNKSSAESMAMLGLMQQLTFVHARIAYQDDSLAGKVMDLMAQKQNMQRKDIANQAKALLPFALAQLNNPGFTTKVTQAVSTFLDDPKNLTIEAAPPAPVPFSMLMAGAMAAPQQLPEQLGVTVEANK